MSRTQIALEHEVHRLARQRANSTCRWRNMSGGADIAGDRDSMIADVLETKKRTGKYEAKGAGHLHMLKRKTEDRSAKWSSDRLIP